MFEQIRSTGSQESMIAVATSTGPVALCAACSRRGACRLGIENEELGSDEIARYSLACPDDYEGGPDVAHGGWTASAMDEVVGHLCLLNGVLAVTGELKVRFIRPVPILTPLVASAWTVRRERKKWFIDGRLQLASSGAELARAEAIMIERDAGHFDRHQEWMRSQNGPA